MLPTLRRNIALMSDHPQRRFTPPWDIEDNGACFIVRDCNPVKRSATSITRMNRAGEPLQAY
jgi:hypothetical protein